MDGLEKQVNEKNGVNLTLLRERAEKLHEQAWDRYDAWMRQSGRFSERETYEPAYDAIVTAILEERERCAKAAERYSHSNPYPTINMAIAAWIRKG